jgi:hypothetical protein
MVKHALLLVTLMLCVCQIAGAKVCTEHGASAAEAITEHLESWSAVNTALSQIWPLRRRRNRKGIPEAVARLLVDHWQILPDPGALIRRNPLLCACAATYRQHTGSPAILTASSYDPPRTVLRAWMICARRSPMPPSGEHNRKSRASM